MTDTATELTYELGVTRIFGNCDIGNNGLVSGWADPEDAHVWNDGPEANLKLIIPKQRSACRLTVEGEPYLGKSLNVQVVTLFMNGFRLACWRLSEARPYTLSALLQPEHFFERKGKSLADIIWNIPSSASPADLGLGVDTRELGFCFRTLVVDAV